MLEEWVHPKSTITPAAAGALAAFIASPFIKIGINAFLACLFSSFLLSCVVWGSREFTEQKFNSFVKVFFYVLNSLVVFAIAVGTHSQIHPNQPNQISELGSQTLSIENLIFGVAHAQEVGEQIPEIIQQRSFTFDWTESHSRTDLIEAPLIQYTVCRDFGGFTNALSSAGLIEPYYDVMLEIDLTRINEEIEGIIENDAIVRGLDVEVTAVRWHARGSDFQNAPVSTADEENNYRLHVEAWKPFEIEVEMELSIPIFDLGPITTTVTEQRVIVFDDTELCVRTGG